MRQFIRIAKISAGCAKWLDLSTSQPKDSQNVVCVYIYISHTQQRISGVAQDIMT